MSLLDAALSPQHNAQFGAAWNYRRGCRCEACVAYKSEQQKGSYARRREKMLEKRRADYAADPVKFRQRARDQRKRTGKKYRNPHKQRESRLLKRYGLTVARYQELLRKQGWGCAICHICFIGPPVLAEPCVDHDHRTGKVRGILCNGCNSGLGYFKDSLLSLLEAMAYLARSL